MPSNSSLEAGAKRDQALAKLFYRSGWTLVELAKVEAKSKSAIDRQMRFGRFLTNSPTGENPEIPLSKLTERRFRDYWSRTDKGETNERIRFGEVLRLIDGTNSPAPVDTICRRAKGFPSVLQ